MHTASLKDYEEPIRRRFLTVIAQLSDPHLDGSPSRLRRLEAVLAQLADLPKVDALLLSGDLADHGRPDEYAQLFEAIPRDARVLAVPGNHDLSASFLQALRDHDRPASLNGVLDFGHLRLVGLDSHSDHNDEGELGPEAIEFARLQLDSTVPTILAMHHPPVSVGHDVVDRFGLANAGTLSQVICENANVVAVLTGHVHTALATTFAGVPLLGAPGIASTMRLGSKTDPIADAEAMPGFALHTVENFTVRTVFHFLSPTAL